MADKYLCRIDFVKLGKVKIMEFWWVGNVKPPKSYALNLVKEKYPNYNSKTDNFHYWKHF